jgi:hypothetical protein
MTWPYMFRPFGDIFTGSTLKGTCFKYAKDLSIVSDTVIRINQIKL